MVFLVGGRVPGNIEKRWKQIEEKHLKNEKKKNEKIQGELNNNQTSLVLSFISKFYVARKHNSMIKQSMFKQMRS